MDQKKSDTETASEKTAERTTEKQPDGGSKTVEKETTKRSESKGDDK